MIKKEVWFAVLLTGITLVFLVIVSATPNGPTTVNNTANSTKASASGSSLNISGGYIATVNITAKSQDLKWKAFIGWVTGKFTLDDSTGSTIYDWAISSVNGLVYATRNSSTIVWANINCSNTTLIEAENIAMNQTNPDDNITRTFNGTTHSSFNVGSITIPANKCPTLATYVNNASQSTNFQEMVLTDKINEVYATKINRNTVGYNGQSYDFQMLVPENGATGNSAVTAYYLYVELT